MKSICSQCGKTIYEHNYFALNKKLNGRYDGAENRKWFCIDCLAEQWNMASDEMLAKIDYYLQQGCQLFLNPKQNVKERELEIKNMSFDERLKIANEQADYYLSKYDVITVGISGGSDSDILLDILAKRDKSKKIIYLFINTGLEYEATKRHIKKLEIKYDIKIHEEKATMPIPTSCKKKGSPFGNKNTSENLYRMQLHNFDFAKHGNLSLQELLNIYCKKSDIPKQDYSSKLYGFYWKGIVSALLWWCNYEYLQIGTISQLQIMSTPLLKEFIIDNPPTFAISAYCCTGAKKQPLHNFLKENNVQLNINGMRKAEGGVRQTAYNSCFSPNTKDTHYAESRLIFYWSDKDKIEYEKRFGIIHSDCYTVYGLKRTGCVTCPMARGCLNELEIVGKYEPKLYNACTNIFGKSFEYTKMYNDYVKERKQQISGQFSLFDYLGDNNSYEKK